MSQGHGQSVALRTEIVCFSFPDPQNRTLFAIGIWLLLVALIVIIRKDEVRMEK